MGANNTTAVVLAYFYTIMFAAVLSAQFGLAFSALPDVPDQAVRMLDISLGVLFALVLASKDYFLGSSRGSARKTELQNRLAEK